jgi:hypothetical protein
MSTVGISISAEIAELRGLQEALGQIFTPKQKTEILKKALTLAIEPTFLRLQQLTPLGPTGNLKRAVSKKIKGYAKDGNAVGLVGYNAGGDAGVLSKRTRAALCKCWQGSVASTSGGSRTARKSGSSRSSRTPRTSERPHTRSTSVGQGV